MVIRQLSGFYCIVMQQWKPKKLMALLAGIHTWSHKVLSAQQDRPQDRRQAPTALNLRPRTLDLAILSRFYRKRPKLVGPAPLCASAACRLIIQKLNEFGIKLIGPLRGASCKACCGASIGPSGLLCGLVWGRLRPKFVPLDEAS